jgi:hypothetical protein
MMRMMRRRRRRRMRRMLCLRACELRSLLTGLHVCAAAMYVCAAGGRAGWVSIDRRPKP